MIRTAAMTSKDAKIRMMRNTGNSSNEEETNKEKPEEEKIEKGQLDVSTLFQGVSAFDFLTDESDSETEKTETIDWEQIKARSNDPETEKFIRDWTEPNDYSRRRIESEMLATQRIGKPIESTEKHVKDTERQL